MAEARRDTRNNPIRDSAAGHLVCLLERWKLNEIDKEDETIEAIAAMMWTKRNRTQISP